MNWRGTTADLHRSLRLLPRVLSGNYSDDLGLRTLFWGNLGNAILAIVSESFKVKLAGGVGSDGVRWAQLAVATLAKRKREGREDGAILHETGAMLESLLPGDGANPSGAENQIFDISQNGLRVGTEDPKADRHQKGTDHMPARPIVPTNPNDFPPGWMPRVEAALQEALTVTIQKMCDGGGIE